MNGVQHKNSSLNQSGSQVILFINFKDFSCTPCMENIMAFIDSVNKYYNENYIHNIVAFILNNYSNKKIAQKVIEGWAKANSISFPVEVVSDTVFDNYIIKNNSIVILNSNEEVIDCEEFPLSKAKNIFF